MAKFKSGFTLAEMMVAMVIVGIVAVFGVTNLINNYFRKANIAQIQKAYHDLEQNLSNYQVNQRLLKGNFFNTGMFAVVSGTRQADAASIKCSFVRNFYKTIANDPQDCVDLPEVNGIKNSPQFSGILNDYTYAVQMKDLSIFAFKYNHDNDDNKAHMNIFVDINGFTKPNADCIDRYEFNVYKDYSIDVLDLYDRYDENKKREDDAVNLRLRCSGYLIDHNWK